MWKAMLFALLLFPFAQPCAQHTISNYRLFTVRDGLPSNEIGRLLEDSYGYLWLGTSHGLSRFNGATFQNFTTATTGFPVTFCTELIQANDSLLLAGTISGILVYNLRRNRFENFRITDSVFALGTLYSTGCIIKLPREQLLVSAGNYVAVLDKHLKTVRKKKMDRPDGFFFRQPVFLDHDSTRLLSGPGLLELDTRSLSYRRSERFPESLIIDHPQVQSMARIDSANLVYSTWSDGFSTYQPGTRQEKRFTISKDGGGEFNSVTDIHRDASDPHLYWLATGSGIIKMNLPGDKPTLYTFLQQGNFNRDLNFCHQVRQDKYGNTWVATKAGLVKISRYYAAFQPLPTFQLSPQGTGKIIMYNSAAGDPKHNKLWIGSYGDYVQQASAEGIRQKHFNEKNSGLGFLVQTLAVYNDTLYAATYFKGLFYFDESTQNFQRPDFLPPALHDTVSSMLYPDSRGRLWITLHKRLAWVDMKTRILHIIHQPGMPTGLPKTPNLASAGLDGDMWFALGGWDGKLYRWSSRENKFFEEALEVNGLRLTRVIIEAMVTDRDNNLWIGTYEHGVLKRDAVTGKITQYLQGLKSPGISSLALDSSGSLWAGTIYGLSVLVKGQQAFRTFTSDDGLPHNSILSIFFPFRNEPGKLLVLMQDKLCWVFTPKLLNGQLPVKTYIEALVVDNEPVPERQSFTFDHKHFRFQFSGVNLSNSDENLYAYMLEGHDKEWIYNSGSPFADYSNLKPGKYVFRVKTATGNGLWSGAATYDFEIIPPFWQRWWFYLLVLAVLVFSAYAFYRYKLGKAIAMYKIRSRISRDLHDEVGSTLSSITLMNEMAVRSKEPQPLQQKIGESLIRVQNAMSDIVWMVNPNNDELNNLQLRFGEVAAQLLEPKGISYSLHFPEEANIRVPMEQRRELFMIYKECLNNIAKYSEATEVDIMILVRNKGIELTVSDNGRGFDPSRHRSGNGLSNMKQRAAQMGGEIHWDTAIGQGTRVKLWFGS